MSEQEYADEDPIANILEKRKRRQLHQYPRISDLSATEDLLAKTDVHVLDSLERQQKIRRKAHFAHLASMSNDVVERGQYMVAAGLAKVFHYEKFHRWSLYESKKGIFSRKERHEEEEQRENVYMEGNDE